MTRLEQLLDKPEFSNALAAVCFALTGYSACVVNPYRPSRWPQDWGAALRRLREGGTSQSDR